MLVLAVRLVVGCDEGCLPLGLSLVGGLLFGEPFGLLHVVEQIDNFLGGILHDPNQISLFEAAVDDHSGYLSP